MTVGESKYQTAETAYRPADLRKSPQALGRSEQRYRSLVLATSSIVWTADPQGRIGEESPSWAAFTGQNFQQYQGWGWLDAIHEEDREQVRRTWSQAILGSRLYELDFRLRRHDGSWRNVLVRAAPVFDEASELREWVGTGTDISDRVRVEDALREEVRISDILHSVGLALVGELDLQKVVERVTDAATSVARASFGAFFYHAAAEPGGRHALYAVSGAAHTAIADFPTSLDCPIFGPAFGGESVVRVDDLAKDPRYQHSDGALRAATDQLPMRSYLAVPVMSRSRQVIGTLLLAHKDAGAFTARDERLVRGAAAQAAIAIDNARLVGDLRTAQQRLAAQLDFTRSITDSVGEGLYAVDASGRATFVNPAAEAMLGWSSAELIGRDMHEVIHPRHADVPGAQPHDCPLTQVLVTARIARVDEDVFVRRDGSTVSVACTSSPTFEDGKISGAVVAFHDITQRKWAQELLRRSNEELERLVAERTTELQIANARLRASNRQLEDFASVASHDLQEPLRKIQAFGDRLEGRSAAALGAEGLDYLKRMRNAAGRMQTLISDLLLFSRVSTQPQTFAHVDLGQIAGEVLSDLETLLEQSGGRVDIDPLPVIEADPIQMRQLLQNLIGNALKFHKPDVPPLVKVRSEPTEPQGTCRIYVEDNGIGFDEKYLDRIFNVFQRLHGHGTYQGTGIGLAVCRKIAERHGGSITAHSQPQCGSMFIVTLPLRQPASEVPNAR